VFDIFTQAAKRAIVLAQDEAIMLGHDFIAAEHLLLGLVGTGDGLAGQVLAEQGATAEQARSLAVDLLTADGLTAASAAEPADALATIGIDVDDVRRRADETFGRGNFVFPRPAYITEAKRAIERSVGEAQALGHGYVGTEHMLLGLLGKEDAPGPRLVRALGLDPAGVRGIVLARLAG
jgi:ATP-dependent Clp protease ATP-binding subunit ClpC